MTLTVDSNLVWQCAVFNRVIDKTCTFLQSFPTTLSHKNINSFATFWKNINICEGNNDVPDAIKQRLDIKLPFASQEGNESMAYLENETMVKLDADSFNIVRVHDCEILLSSIKHKCTACVTFRLRLRTIKCRQLNSDDHDLRTTDSSKANLLYLLREEMEK